MAQNRMNSKASIKSANGIVELSYLAIAKVLDSYIASLRNRGWERMSEEDWEDFRQDCLERIYQNLDRFDPSKGLLSTWVGRIARNKFLDTVAKLYDKKKARNDEADEDMLSEIPEEDRLYVESLIAPMGPSESEAWVDDHIGSNVDVQAVEAAIHRLDKDGRMIMDLTIDGHKPGEIAGLIGKTPGAVSTKLNRTRFTFAKDNEVLLRECRPAA